jgi:hypothetical protein
MDSYDERTRLRFAAKGAPVDDDDKDDDDTPEKRFEERYPQDIRVSDMVVKPLLETDNTPIGRIKGVARSPDGKLVLIVPVGGFLGFGGRLVAVPNEAVASIGTAIISVDMDRAAYAQAATWTQGSDTLLPPETPMRVAITRH